MKNKTRKNLGGIRQTFVWLGIICTVTTAFLVFFAELLGMGDRLIFHRELSKEMSKMPKESISVPLKEYRDHMYVQGSINGKQKLNMLDCQ
jgi:hypothetical protein